MKLYAKLLSGEATMRLLNLSMLTSRLSAVPFIEWQTFHSPFSHWRSYMPDFNFTTDSSHNPTSTIVPFCCHSEKMYFSFVHHLALRIFAEGLKQMDGTNRNR